MINKQLVNDVAIWITMVPHQQHGTCVDVGMETLLLFMGVTNKL